MPKAGQLEDTRILPVPMTTIMIARNVTPNPTPNTNGHFDREEL